MNITLIEKIEQKRNKLQNKILKKGKLATKKEIEILNKYEILLLDQFKKNSF